jgi:hypothetical protein
MTTIRKCILESMFTSSAPTCVFILCALLYFSTGYKPGVLIGAGWICTVLSMELLQFYYSPIHLWDPRIS